MTAMADRVTTAPPRLADRMCPAHVEQCRTRWPGDETWQALRDRCPLCWIKSEGMSDCIALPDLPESVFEQAKAIHEAGHAVAALAGGMTVRTVQVWPGHEPGRNGGNTSVDLPPGGVRAGRYFAMLWSGQEAADRYLTEAGYGTPANRLDLRFLARGDAAEFDAKVAEHGLTIPADTGVDEARGLIGFHWDEIWAVADALVVEHLLTGDQVERLIGMGELR